MACVPTHSQIQVEVELLLHNQVKQIGVLPQIHQYSALRRPIQLLLQLPYRITQPFLKTTHSVLMSYIHVKMHL